MGPASTNLGNLLQRALIRGSGVRAPGRVPSEKAIFIGKIGRVYEVRAKIHHGVDLISDALPFGRLWYAEPNAVSDAIDYAQFFSRSHNVIRVYGELV